jgi:hypothetical protein
VVSPGIFVASRYCKLGIACNLFSILNIGASEDNLIVNPGFESGLSGWVPYSLDQCTVTSSTARSGLQSLECGNPGPTYKQQGHKQGLTLNQVTAQPILISGTHRPRKSDFNFLNMFRIQQGTQGRWHNPYFLWSLY